MISIDIGSFETKVIEAKVKRDFLKINQFFSFKTPLDSYQNGYIINESTLIDRFKKELTNKKIIKGNCYINFSSIEILNRVITLPFLKKDELEGLIQYQIADYFPVDLNNYTIQYRIIEKINIDNSESCKILIVAIPSEIVNNHYKLITKIGLTPRIMDCQCNSIWKLIKYSNKINDNVLLNDKTIAAIDLGYKKISITIIENNLIQFSKTIDIDSSKGDKSLRIKEYQNDGEGILNYNYINNNVLERNDCLTEDAGQTIKSKLEDAIKMINRIFRYYSALKANNEIHTILLYGGLSNTTEIEEAFTNSFNMPVYIINKIDRIRRKGNINKFVNCIGSLIRDDGVHYR